jgi:putative ABC transport system substrate-binding protein
VKASVLKAIAFSLCLLTAPWVATAQPTDKVSRIGFLGFGIRGPYHQLLEQALVERGWVTGKNLIVLYRHADEKYDRLPALAVELVRLEPQVIVAVPTVSVLAARNATNTIPIVMAGVADPIGEKLIASFARPGGNVTGLTGSLSWTTYTKQLQFLKEAVPSARRIALLRDPANSASLPSVRTFTEAARSLGVELPVVHARTPDEFEPAFLAAVQARADGLIIHREGAFARHLARLADLSVRHRLPSICASDAYAKAGGLMTYAVSSADEARQIASYVDRLLRGANPAELPVEQPTNFELVINLKTAKALGVTVPPSLRLQAAQVID